MMYSALPFRFASFDNRVLVVNFVGDYKILSAEDFGLFLSGGLQESSETFHDLQGLQIISSGDVETDMEILATRYRSKKAFLDDFTTLHMVVTTLRCNQQCRYCHATAKKEDDSTLTYDMTVETATQTAKTIMLSPSPVIKVEFQGGDSSLNMKVVKTVVEEVDRLNIDAKKDVEFVLCTNLLSVNSEDMDYLRLHKFCVSISLDGPKDLHDANRIDCGDQGTYDRVIANLPKMREYVGYENVGALMTATRKSLGRFPEIVDEYVRQGFDQIIFRPLNPYGRCITNWDSLGYTMDEYLSSYKEGLKYIIDLNKRGVRITEGYTRLLISRMLTPFPTGYVDLQSPAGAGILGVIYDYDGGIYACDEGRMLSEMGDERLHIGDVRDDYNSVFNGRKIREIIGESLLETTPMCADCVYRMWCGADPARHYATQHDLMGHKAISEFCKKHKAMFDYLIRLIESDKEARDILFSWVGGRLGGGVA
ncbi:MAG: His-Xaa-Ser system radical SAM maturase HxsB [Kiritimatiellae bacterium]|nr:His-Xaa-Ser system radical SAM maturase HxsB [Kiritimatiellia bacterium]